MSISRSARRVSAWKRVLLVAVLVPLVGAGSVVPAYAAPSDPVEFRDANLETCVRKAVKVESPVPVTEADMATLTSLRCAAHYDARGYVGGEQAGVISDVSPLRHATNLEDLRLDYYAIKNGNFSSSSVANEGPDLDVSPLAGLTNLVEIELFGQAVSDVSPLASLPKLHTLSIPGGRLTDASLLANLTISKMPPECCIGTATEWFVQSDVWYRWFSEQRVEAVAVAGVPVASPVTDLEGTKVVLTPLDASGTVSGTDITWSTPGVHKASWKSKIHEHDFSGIVTFTVTDPMVGVENVPSAGQVGVEYQHEFGLSGAPDLPTVAGVDLPPGLSVSEQGVLSGVPTQAGTFAFTLTATNGLVSREFPFTVTIAPAAVEPPEPPTPPLSCVTPRKDSVFRDVAVTQKFYAEIDWMHCMNLSTGWKKSSGKPLYKPKDGLSREAMAAFMYRLEGPENYRAPKKSPFTDVPTSHKFYREIAWMKESKLSTGFADGSYRPKDGLSREAMAAFIYRFEAKSSKDFIAPKKAVFTDVPVGQKFAREIAWMKELKLSTGFADGSYRPKDGLSREAMAAFIYRLRGSVTS